MLPSKIKLLEKEYNIYEVQSFNENKLGIFIEKDDIIKIYVEQSKSSKELTLLHELAHAMFIQMCDKRYFDDEELMDKIALFTYSLIKNNDFSFMKDNNGTI